MTASNKIKILGLLLYCFIILLISGCFVEDSGLETQEPLESLICERGTLEANGFCVADKNACGKGTHWNPENSSCQLDIPVCANQKELCDGIDNNCNGEIDEGFPVGSLCRGKFGVCTDSGIFHCSSDKESVICSTEVGGNQSRATEEKCDYIDNDCDGEIDESCIRCCLDYDGDGSTSMNQILLIGDTCPHNYIECGNFPLSDCDDSNPRKGPQNHETCDYLDNDCDNLIDEGCMFSACYGDADCIAGLGCTKLAWYGQCTVRCGPDDSSVCPPGTLCLLTWVDTINYKDDRWSCTNKNIQKLDLRLAINSPKDKISASKDTELFKFYTKPTILSMFTQLSSITFKINMSESKPGKYAKFIFSFDGPANFSLETSAQWNDGEIITFYFSNTFLLENFGFFSTLRADTSTGEFNPGDWIQIELIGIDVNIDPILYLYPFPVKSNILTF